ncbi:hypothetical protein GTGU_03581 [Trabulsiella guamensis ATCC 49490]|uniref:Uncharacterized protein n=1 Tax=Trabulsiella guamensis ATCC 49490 TaxID=1005994 RepID=A0A084ZUB9_9ENTR|nr:hypothetical protein [Trabulsiella guamensis]KFC01064.1 hypothetical protein GTGU_03581 [Trabulsiella guamensis ATCC 49490]
MADMSQQQPQDFSLDDFTDTPSYSINDFQDVDSVGEVLPPDTSLASNRNRATVTALLNSNDPEQQIATYQTINNELINYGNSPTMKKVTEQYTVQAQDEYRRTTADFLANPEVSDEWKAQAIANVNDRNNPLYNPRALLATKEATQPVSGETEEAADLRGVWAASIGEVLNYQREQQKALNTMQQKDTVSAAPDVVAFGEDLIPLVSGAKTAGTVRSLGGSGLDALKGFFLPGSAKAKIAEDFNNLPMEDRRAALETIATAMNKDGKTILLPDSIDQENYEAFQQVIQNGTYTVTDKVVDNIFGLLDITGIGSVISKSARAVGKAGKVAEGVEVATEATDLARSWQRRFIASDVQPTSPSQTIKDANPTKARALHSAVDADESGDVASNLYGTSREDAIAHDLAPQPSSVGGGVKSKVSRPEISSDMAAMADTDMLDIAVNTAAPHISQREKRALAANVTNDFQNATGMVNRKEMTSIAESMDGGLNISAVYGPTDSGWSNVQDAFNQAQYALAKYGVDESDITILVRSGDDYIPVGREAQDALLKGNNTQIKGDYLLQIKQRYEYNSGDLRDEQFEKFGVGGILNVFNRFQFANGKTGQGSLTSQVIDPASMFSPEFLKGAVLGDIKADAVSQKLLDASKPFIQAMKRVSPERHFVMEQRIKSANLKGQALTETGLRAEGFNTEEIAGLLSFRQTQDTLWSLTNADLVKSYINRGYGKLTHKDSGFDVIAKPLPRNQVAADIKAYDPVTDEVKTLSKQEISEMYGRNASVAETADVLNIDGTPIQYVINHNAPNSGYIRKLNLGEPILSYRHGYYAVRYKDPHFIERKLVDENGAPLKDSNGNEIWKAVATAPDIPSAQKAIGRYTATNGGEYRLRNDLKGEDYEKANTQLHTASGLSSQRVRGKRLEDSLGSNFETDAVHIESPGESMLNSINAVSSRISYRDWLETSKRRLIATYSDVLPKKDGRIRYPSNVSEIKGTSKEAADARATFEYIRAMENGYTNLIDDGYKSVVNNVAEMLGEKGFGKLEQIARKGSEASPSNIPKRVSFNLMIALSPLRQLVLQSSQNILLATRFPSYAPRLIGDNLLLITHHLSAGKDLPEAVYKTFGRSKEEWKAMMKAMDESGITKGISKHDIAKGLVESTADSSLRSMKAVRDSKLKKVVKAPVTAGRAVTAGARKIGFDAGEYMVQAGSFMAHYTDATKGGKALTKAELDDVIHMSRNFTGNFGRSGNLAMNQNTLSFVTQYLQVPIKLAQLFLFNKAIPLKNRVGMGVSASVLFGFGTEDVYNLFSDDLPSDPFARELITHGLISAAANGFIRGVTGDASRIDFGSLNPFNAFGAVEFLDKAMNSGLVSLVTESPSGSLIFGSNPRITNLLRTVGQLVGVMPVGDNMQPKLLGQLWKDVANLASGTSNGLKAKMALEYRKVYSATGQLVAGDISTPEAFALAIGLPVQDGQVNWALTEKLASAYKTRKEDVQEIFDQTSRILVAEGTRANEWEYMAQMSQTAMSVFKDDPAAREMWMDMLKKKMSDGDARLINRIMDAAQWEDPAKIQKMIDELPGLTPEQRHNYKEYAKALSGDKAE